MPEKMRKGLFGTKTTKTKNEDGKRKTRYTKSGDIVEKYKVRGSGGEKVKSKIRNTGTGELTKSSMKVKGGNLGGPMAKVQYKQKGESLNYKGRGKSLYDQDYRGILKTTTKERPDMMEYVRRVPDMAKASRSAKKAAVEGAYEMLQDSVRSYMGRSSKKSSKKKTMYK